MKLLVSVVGIIVCLCFLSCKNRSAVNTKGSETVEESTTTPIDEKESEETTVTDERKNQNSQNTDESSSGQTSPNKSKANPPPAENTTGTEKSSPENSKDKVIKKYGETKNSLDDTAAEAPRPR